MSDLMMSDLIIVFEIDALNIYSAGKDFENPFAQ
jgi:hypothetical protein